LFSRRLPVHVQANALSRALERLGPRRAEIADLTESNPTRAGICYPDELLAPLGDQAGLRYEPQPLGLMSARIAVAADQRRRGALVDPAHIVLATSTSEAYSWLFKLLCNPGEGVLVPRPSYPLFEHLTALEGVRACSYALEYDGRWSIDMESLATAPSDVRALILVSPNNPTGSWVANDDLERVSALCRDRRWTLIVDEVFADYPLDATDVVTDIASTSEMLSFTLAGLSKTVGLPQVKLGWLIAGGPASERDAALSALELVADSYLSVSVPVQLAAPHLLREGGSIRAAIQERTRTNLGVLRTAATKYPACDLLRADGGWSAVLRAPSTRPEEQLVLDLLAEERILVHPGYFFDFPRETYLVLSLLPQPTVFADAAERLLRFVSR
jgi:aspartate/methionine/tyrosine aminotransferase